MKKTSENGQSTIEFLMTFIFAIGFVFLFVFMCMNYSMGYVAHYATYMASRAYLTYDRAENDPLNVLQQAERHAQEVFQSYPISLFPLERKMTLKINSPESVQYEYVGAYFEFGNPLSNFRLVGGDIYINYLSESFLGKEPSRIECFERICDIMAVSCNGNVSNSSMVLFDNGC